MGAAPPLQACTAKAACLLPSQTVLGLIIILSHSALQGGYVDRMGYDVAALAAPIQPIKCAWHHPSPRLPRCACLPWHSMRPMPPAPRQQRPRTLATAPDF